MSTATEHAPVENEESWIKQDMVYIKTAGLLGVLTAVEVFTYFESVHKLGKVPLTIILSVLMAVKFYVVAMVFMHLKNDNAVFTKVMTMGLCLAWVVYFVLGFTFGWLPDWNGFVRAAMIGIPPVIVGAWLGFSFKGGDGSH